MPPSALGATGAAAEALVLARARAGDVVAASPPGDAPPCEPARRTWTTGGGRGAGSVDSNFLQGSHVQHLHFKNLTKIKKNSKFHCILQKL